MKVLSVARGWFLQIIDAQPPDEKRVIGTLYACRLRLMSLLLGRDEAFRMLSETLAAKPGLWGRRLRQAAYGRLLARCGRGVHFGFLTLLSKPDATIGQRVYLGRMCTLGLTDIGDDAKLADGVQVLSGSHQHGEGARFERVRIGSRAWIGAHAVIMADVGDDAVVGAGAVVTRPVPAGVTVVGVPARPIHASPTSQASQAA